MGKTLSDIEQLLQYFDENVCLCACALFFYSFSIRIQCKRKVIWVWKPWNLMCITYNASNTLRMHQWMHHECITNTMATAAVVVAAATSATTKWQQQYHPRAANVCCISNAHTLRSNANSILSINITKGTKLIIVHGTSSKCIWSVLFAMYFIYAVRFACVCVSNANAEKLYNYLWIELQAQREATQNTTHTHNICVLTTQKTAYVRYIAVKKSQMYEEE